MTKLIITKKTPVVEKEEEEYNPEDITEEDEKKAKCEMCSEIGNCNHNFWLVLDNPDERLVFGLCGECDPPEDEEDEEEEEEERDWWLAHHGKIEFMTATEKVVEEIGADEWGAIDSFVDNRKVEE
tara:strand:- start:41 stop:418 length:378 start_codon:yes stop_codon:yes gene_type:complete